MDGYGTDGYPGLRGMVHRFFWSGHVQVQQQNPRRWFRHHPPRVCLEVDGVVTVRDGPPKKGESKSKHKVGSLGLKL